MNFTIDMEELQITGSDLKTIKAHAFKHINGLKYLDLSDNAISLLDSEAFKEVKNIFYTCYLKKLIKVKCFFFKNLGWTYIAIP